jgi:glycine C-acetyltransferase
MFSCALDPAVTGGILKALELASGPDGDEKRKRIVENSDYLRSLLKNKVDIGTSQSWVIPIIYVHHQK